MTDPKDIEARIRTTLERIPSNVAVVAAAKTRSVDEIGAAIETGIARIGHNYVQEAQAAVDRLGRGAAAWHMIGHLQRNKAKDAVRLFDLIQTVDSVRLAAKLDREADKIGRTLPILIEINSGREPQKAGVVPEDAEELIREIAPYPSLRVEGLMTMGPLVNEPEQIRPSFAETKRLFDRLASLGIPRVDLRTLSMGMSASYRIAIEEGATMVRLGTVLFGPREA